MGGDLSSIFPLAVGVVGINSPVKINLNGLIRGREVLIDKLLVRTHFIIEMTPVHRPCAMKV